MLTRQHQEILETPFFSAFQALTHGTWRFPGWGANLQLPAYTTSTAMADLSLVCDLRYSSWQRQILNPLSKVRDGTCILVDTSRIRFHCATTEILGNTLYVHSLKSPYRTSECLGKKIKQSSPVWSLNHDKTEVQVGSNGLPGNVTFTRPQHLPLTQRCQPPHQSEVAKCRQCSQSSLAKDPGRDVLCFQHTFASF